MILKIKFKTFLILFFFLLFFYSEDIFSQASIEERTETIETYPYSDPNPVPSLAINEKVARFYPYYVFDGYTDKSISKDWKIVELENPFIKVMVLPEVGGKVMGALEKSTGKEFIYLNHVMKFRSIGIRGPWTSGGIEHNFGLDLGHAPWTAAPVDYMLKENADGSVSCIVGGLDLASRTQWRIIILLPKDKAYFETQSLWYNPNPLHDAYLSWENAAYKATNDLEFFFPGTHHIGHGGSAYSWPTDEKGRNLSLYKENDFGPSKSYHVMGSYENWFGGYWHKKDFGFGHWAPYSDAPGKKLWIWSLARSGAIWEDLLTDEDGQYIEAQSGVKFNQASEDSGFDSPFNQLRIGPYYTETKTEYWFPVKETKGMVDASPDGTLNVLVSMDSLKVSVSANTTMNDSLIVKIDNVTFYAERLQLKPMEVYHKTIPFPGSKKEGLKVRIGNKLKYSVHNSENEINRPIRSQESPDSNSAEHLFRMAEDVNAMRNYEKALDLYNQVIELEPTHSLALTRIAELHYRSGRYEKGLVYSRKVLENNTYDGGANFFYGVIQKALGNSVKAKEALSVAARTMEYRSAAYTEISGINAQKQDFRNANIYARKALDYNRNNLRAYEFLGTSYRKLKNFAQAEKTLDELLEIDPLNHYARFEQYLLHPTPVTLNIFKSGIRNELPHETYLELAMAYVNQGLNDEAIKVLEQAPAYPTVSYWLAYLNKDVSPEKSRNYLQQAEDASPELVFPFRLETIPVLQWAQKQSASWKTMYYLGLIYWSKSDVENAKDLFEKCKNNPEFAPFYMSRGILFQGDSTKDNYLDFKKANQLNPKEWRTWHYLSDYYKGKGNFQQAVTNAKKAYALFSDNPVIGLDYAKALVNVEDFQKSVQVLHKVQILPQEGAREGHDIYELANLALAVNNVEKKKYKEAIQYLNESKKWPENLGAGKPYDPDNRLQNFLAAYCETQLSHQKEADLYEKNIADYSLDSEHWNVQNTLNNYLSVLVLQKREKQEETDKLVSIWKTSQDSLSNWNIAAGAASPETQWVLAKYRNKDQAAEELEEKIVAKGNLKQNIFFKVIELADMADN
jgi:tetratricopeptide (TPR) repeat protein